MHVTMVADLPIQLHGVQPGDMVTIRPSAERPVGLHREIDMSVEDIIQAMEAGALRLHRPHESAAMLSLLASLRQSADRRPAPRAPSRHVRPTRRRYLVRLK